MFDTLECYKDKRKYAQINAMLCAEGKSLADFPQIEQLQKNDEEDDFMTLKQVMKIGTRQYNQLNKKQKNSSFNIKQIR